MNLISAEKTGGSSAEVKFQIEGETFSREVTRVFKQMAPKISVPGFRPGKAPRAVIEKMYGKGSFYERALDNLLEGEWEQARRESGLRVVGQPQVEVEQMGEDGVTITAKVSTYPDVTLKTYKGIPVTRRRTVVTDEQVEEKVSEARESNARSIDVTNRPAQKGDTVTFDFEGRVDGELFEGGSAKGQELTLGSGSFIPGFEEQIEGKTLEAPFEVNVTFPEDYRVQELAGKPAVFSCVLHEISQKELPEPDDEFAKDVSEFDTMEEYRADIRAKLQAERDKETERDIEEQLINALTADDNFEADIPAALIDLETENLLRDFDFNLRSGGLDLKTYLQYTGGDLDSLRESFRPNALRRVKSRLSLERVAELEAFPVSDERIEQEYEKLAKEYDLSVERVKEIQEREEVARDIAVEIASDFVKENAVITDAAPDSAPEGEAAGAEDAGAGENSAGESAPEGEGESVSESAGE